MKYLINQRWCDSDELHVSYHRRWCIDWWRSWWPRTRAYHPNNQDYEHERIPTGIEEEQVDYTWIKWSTTWLTGSTKIRTGLLRDKEIRSSTYGFLVLLFTLYIICHCSREQQRLSRFGTTFHQFIDLFHSLNNRVLIPLLWSPCPVNDPLHPESKYQDHQCSQRHCYEDDPAYGLVYHQREGGHTRSTDDYIRTTLQICCLILKGETTNNQTARNIRELEDSLKTSTVNTWVSFLNMV